jgi:tRNA(Ile)-lysidine synthase
MKQSPDVADDASMPRGVAAFDMTEVRARLRWPAAGDPRQARPWLVGFSHGPDSTLLLTLAEEHCARVGLPDPIAVHIDHAWRPESRAEAEQARGFAAGLGLEFCCERLPGARSEAEARELRLAAFARAAEAEAHPSETPPTVLLGQHLDDQRETVLFRLLRGTGPLGLAGMRPEAHVRGLRIARPLLELPRDAILRELQERELPYVQDPSNLDPGHNARSRIRHQVLPRWRQRDPDYRLLDALQRQAAALRHSVEIEMQGCEDELGRCPAQLPLELLARVSPWCEERLYARRLRELGHEAPPRRHLLRLRALRELSPGRRVEARGRWRVLRERVALRFENW